MATPQEYYNKVIGKKYDEDKVYGAQCVDGFKHFCRTVLNFDISNKSICSPTGFATSIWDNYENLGLNKYFDKVASNQLEDGDWAIWSRGSKDCPNSHIAMFRKDNGNGTGVFLGQNQFGKRCFTQGNIKYDGLRGGLRPKIYHGPSYDTGLYKTLYNMKVRSGPALRYEQVKVCDLTADGKAHATSQSPNAKAVYKKDTIFTAKEIIVDRESVWAKSPSGFICIKDSNQTYCEKVN